MSAATLRATPAAPTERVHTQPNSGSTAHILDEFQNDARSRGVPFQGAVSERPGSPTAAARSSGAYQGGLESAGDDFIAGKAPETAFLTLRDIIDQCRRPVIRTRKWGGDPPSRVKAAIINCLRTAAGGVVSTDALIEAVYGADPEGGPLTAVNCLRVVIHRLRAEGWPIASDGYRGYRYGSAA